MLNILFLILEFRRINECNNELDLLQFRIDILSKTVFVDLHFSCTSRISVKIVNKQ